MSQTVKQSIASWRELRHLDERVQFHIVLDADTKLGWSDEVPPFINVNWVPKSFRPRLALYKARALEFFRRNVHLEEDDWVLHLDEETQLDSYAINAVLDFIERGDEHVGMVCRLGTIRFKAMTNISPGDRSFQHWCILAEPIPGSVDFRALSPPEPQSRVTCFNSGHFKEALLTPKST